MKLAVVAGISVTSLFSYEVFYWLTHVYEYDARIEAELTTLSSRIDGEIEKVYVKEGDRVKQGDLLVALKSEVQQLKIKALEAELAESINDRRPKTMEEVDEVISSIYDALGDGGEGPLSKDDALFALGMSPPPALYYAKKTVIIFLYYYVMYACIPLQPTNLKYTDLWDNSWDNAISMYFSL